MKLDIDLQCRGLSRAQFVDLYYGSEDFNRAAQLDGELHERVVLEPEELAAGRVRRRVRVTPRVALPGPLNRLIAGAPITYVEVLTFEPDLASAELAIESPGGDYVTVRGTLSLAERRELLQFRLRGHVQVSVPLVGGLAERFIAAEVKRRYALLEGFLQEYVDDLSR